MNPVPAPVMPFAGSEWQPGFPGWEALAARGRAEVRGAVAMPLAVVSFAPPRGASPAAAALRAPLAALALPEQPLPLEAQALVRRPESPALAESPPWLERSAESPWPGWLAETRTLSIQPT